MNVLIFDKSLDHVDLVPLHFAMPSTSYQSGLTKVRPRIFSTQAIRIRHSQREPSLKPSPTWRIQCTMPSRSKFTHFRSPPADKLMNTEYRALSPFPPWQNTTVTAQVHRCERFPGRAEGVKLCLGARHDTEPGSLSAYLTSYWAPEFAASLTIIDRSGNRRDGASPNLITSLCNSGRASTPDDPRRVRCERVRGALSGLFVVP